MQGFAQLLSCRTKEYSHIGCKYKNNVLTLHLHVCNSADKFKFITSWYIYKLRPSCLKKVNDGELAARLNKSRKYVNQVATGNKPASLKMYARFAKALQVPLAALFDGYPLHLLDD